MFPVLLQLLERYPEKANLIIKHFPLRSHPYAKKAAIACLAASRQNKYRELSEMYTKNYRKLNDTTIRKYAEDIGLNMETFDKDRQSSFPKNIINNDVKLARKLGIRGVPSIFINGRRVKNRSLEAMAQMVENEFKTGK